MPDSQQFLSRLLRASAVGAGALGLALTTAGPAHAEVLAYPEPGFTNTTNNTWFFSYTRVQGTTNEYFICFTLRRNGVVIEPSNGVNGPGSQNCTGNIYANGASGNTGGIQPDPATLPLTVGSTYELCATDFRSFGVIYSFASSACRSTTIDNTKPAIGVFVNGTDIYTRNLGIQIHIDYADAIAVPYPANFGCLALGGGCPVNPATQYVPGCSVPNGSIRVTSFDCSATLAASTPDGLIAFCARAADAAIPDNPASSNQAQPASSANISDPSCGSVTLDRTPPSVSLSASATAVEVGELVNFSAQSSDAISGTSGAYAWNFGDNTPNGGGANTTHTYTQAGTYEVTLSTTDGAGNGGQAKRTITVSAGDDDTGGGTGGGTGGTGGTIIEPPTGKSISNQSGGGGTQKTSLAGLKVLAPKRFKIRKGRRTLLMTLSSTRAGRVKVGLSRGRKVVARGAATFTRAGLFGFKLKLPAKMKPGAYKLTIRFKPKGSTKTSKKTLRIRFVGGKAKGGAAAAHTPFRAR